MYWRVGRPFFVRRLVFAVAGEDLKARCTFSAQLLGRERQSAAAFLHAAAYT